VTTALLSGQAQAVSRWTVADTDDAFLGLNATALRTLGWALLDSQGRELDGPQLLVKGRRLRHPDGTVRIASSALELLRFLDTNSDGEISLGDALTGSLAYFTDLDADGSFGASDRWLGIWDLVESIRISPPGIRTRDGSPLPFVEPGCAP
jgi:hypothetical protein